MILPSHLQQPTPPQSRQEADVRRRRDAQLTDMILDELQAARELLDQLGEMEMHTGCSALGVGSRCSSPACTYATKRKRNTEEGITLPPLET